MGTVVLYRPNSEEVAAKVLDGEAILINLSTGTYYSLDGAGCTVWEGIESGASAMQLAGLLQYYFNASPEVAAADVERLLAELSSENLVIAEQVDDAGLVQPEVLAVASGKYSTPVLSIFRDMQDLLALDPPLPGLENSAVSGRPSDNRK